MNIKNLLFNFILLALISSSCVSNKKLTYLKHEGELKNDVVYDSVYRQPQSVSYAINKLRPFDQIMVEVKTVTPPEYNPFAYVESIAGSNVSSMQNPEQGSVLGYILDEKGDVDLPILGVVHLGGLTFSEAEQKIKKALDGLMDNPAVRIKLLNFRYSIIGEVARPGIYGTYNREISVLEAVAKAGGIQEFGNRAKVKLLRKNGDHIDVIYLNLNDENFISSPYYYLHQEDILVILPIDHRPSLEYIQKNVSIIASITAAIVSIVTLITVNR